MTNRCLVSAIVPSAREIRCCYRGPSNQPCLPLDVTHPIVFRPLCSLRQADGGMPTNRVKTRVRWLWSANPQSTAISAVAIDDSSNNVFACSILRTCSHLCGVMPVVMRNDRMK